MNGVVLYSNEVVANAVNEVVLHTNEAAANSANEVTACAVNGVENTPSSSFMRPLDGANTDFP